MSCHVMTASASFLPFLFSAKPARDSALGLGGFLLDCLVELIYLLESGRPGVLCVGLSISLCFCEFGLRLGDLLYPVIKPVSH